MLPSKPLRSPRRPGGLLGRRAGSGRHARPCSGSSRRCDGRGCRAQEIHRRFDGVSAGDRVSRREIDGPCRSSRRDACRARLGGERSGSSTGVLPADIVLPRGADGPWGAGSRRTTAGVTSRRGAAYPSTVLMGPSPRAWRGHGRCIIRAMDAGSRGVDRDVVPPRRVRDGVRTRPFPREKIVGPGTSSSRPRDAVRAGWGSTSSPGRPRCW